MKQTKAIFVKDARRFWPEIAVSLLLVAVFVFVYPSSWGHDSSRAVSFGVAFAIADGGKGFLSSSLIFLIPISWLILTARLVHCERLVGSTQFWLTRPYEWPKLLAAKAIFLAVFLFLPFLIAQCLLIKEAGLHPLQHLGGLLFNLLLVALILILPAFALSSLTAGMARFLLFLLGFTVYVLLIAVFASYIPRELSSSTPDLISGTLAKLLLLVACLTVILIMYARRRLRAGWTVFLGALFLLWATSLADPDRAVMARNFPLEDSAAQSVQIAYAAEGLKLPLARDTRNKSEIEVSLPLNISIAQDQKAAVLQSMRVSISVPDGAHWRSQWQSAGYGHFIGVDNATTVTFFMPRTVYERLKNASLALHFDFAVSEATQIRNTTVPLPDHDFDVQDFGVCAPWSWYPNKREYSTIICRSAMREPSLTYVSAHWAQNACAASTSSDQTGMLAAAWTGTLDTAPAQFGITSVWSVPLNLSNAWFQSNTATKPRVLCPGTPITFREFKETRRMMVQVNIDNFRLPEIMSAEQMSAEQ